MGPESSTRMGSKEGYSTERDYYQKVAPAAKERAKEVETALKEAFRKFLVRKEHEVIQLREISNSELAGVMLRYPQTLKPLFVLCGVAARAIERDLDIRNLDTYNPKLSEADAQRIAGYIKEMLPDEVSIEALRELDRVEFMDKEKRRAKGHWEDRVRDALSQGSGLEFRKRSFTVGGEQYEIDAAYPVTGPVEVAIDVKRIEARRDFQKRSDEIVNKSTAFKKLNPRGKFAAVVYYPFEQEAVRSRLISPDIDVVEFATDDDASIAIAAKNLTKTLRLKSRS